MAKQDVRVYAGLADAVIEEATPEFVLPPRVDPIPGLRERVQKLTQKVENEKIALQGAEDALHEAVAELEAALEEEAATA